MGLRIEIPFTHTRLLVAMFESAWSLDIPYFWRYRRTVIILKTGSTEDYLNKNLISLTQPTNCFLQSSMKAFAQFNLFLCGFSQWKNTSFVLLTGSSEASIYSKQQWKKERYNAILWLLLGYTFEMYLALIQMMFFMSYFYPFRWLFFLLTFWKVYTRTH